ncbi:MAG TPA: succinate dehydrogenase, hydrophobic membrane anchor protein [Xanthobacteraceae bacterium]
MSLRTPLGHVRGLGSAKSGTKQFWHQRLTSVASVPLSIFFVVLVVSLIGRNHAAAVQILGSAWIAVLLLLFILTIAYHMQIGMQEIIEDYAHGELSRLVLLIANTFFSIAIGLASVFAILKISFGV